jgi:hypothetical protein
MDWGLPELADSQEQTLSAVDADPIEGLFSTLKN